MYANCGKNKICAEIPVLLFRPIYNSPREQTGNFQGSGTINAAWKNEEAGAPLGYGVYRGERFNKTPLNGPAREELAAAIENTVSNPSCAIISKCA